MPLGQEHTFTFRGKQLLREIHAQNQVGKTTTSEKHLK